MTMEQKKCLIVDDEDLILQLLSTFLRLEGYICTTATSGEAALDMLNSEPFDIMITDVAMHAMNGIELTKKAKDLYFDMPIIIMTGFLDEYTYDGAIEAGASDFLKKPFTPKEMLTRITRVMRDANIVASLKHKGKITEAISTEMIAGLEEESQEKIEELEKEVKNLKEQLSSRH